MFTYCLTISAGGGRPPRGAFSLQYIEISVAERARKNDTPLDFRAENAVTSQDEEMEKIN